MAKNLMTIFLMLSILSIQIIICEKITHSNHLQTDLSFSESSGFGDNNRLLSIVTIATNDETTTNGQDQTQNPFVGDVGATTQNQKGYSSTFKNFTTNNYYKFQLSYQSGFLLNSQSTYYVDAFGNAITHLMQIEGQCSPANYNPNGNYYLQFNPQTYLMGGFSIALDPAMIDGQGLYQSWVPLDPFIFPYIPYMMVVHGWCGIDNIGPQLNSTSAGYTIG